MKCIYAIFYIQVNYYILVVNTMGSFDFLKIGYIFIATGAFFVEFLQNRYIIFLLITILNIVGLYCYFYLNKSSVILFLSLLCHCIQITNQVNSMLLYYVLLFCIMVDIIEISIGIN